jgi:hypothetical protein
MSQPQDFAYGRWVTGSLGELTRPFRHCEERSDEAIQEQRVTPLDCFGTTCLAMTIPYKMMLGLRML